MKEPAMIFETEDGRKFSVGIAHTTTEISRYPGQQVRCTRIWLQGKRRNGLPIDIVAQAVCSPDDNFSKKEGRHRARVKFMKMLETSWCMTASGHTITSPIISEFTREDRKKLFMAIYPEHHKRKAKSMMTADTSDSDTELVFSTPTRETRSTETKSCTSVTQLQKMVNNMIDVLMQKAKSGMSKN